jgi:hypothetical protein
VLKMVNNQKGLFWQEQLVLKIPGPKNIGAAFLNK